MYAKRVLLTNTPPHLVTCYDDDDDDCGDDDDDCGEFSCNRNKSNKPTFIKRQFNHNNNNKNSNYGDGDDSDD
jgi:hypothetical protein